MSDMPQRNHKRWRWKWKKRKSSKKNKVHYSSGQLSDSFHDNSYLGDVKAQTSCHQGSDRSNKGLKFAKNFPRATCTNEAGPSSNQNSTWTTDSTHPSTSALCLPVSGHKRTCGGEKSDKFRTKCTCTSHQDSEVTQNACGSTGSTRTGASTAEQSAKSGPVREIPGFYYDPERKRYFRLVAGHNNFNPLTRESLERKDAERRRQEMLNGNPLNCSKQETPVKKKLSLCPLQRSVQSGHLTSRQFMRYAQEQAVRRLDLKPSKLDNFPDQYLDGESGDISFLQVDKSQRQVLMVISHDYLSRMWQGTIAHDPSKARALTVSNWRVINIIGMRNSKITSASWVSTDDPDNLHIIYSFSGGLTSSVQLLKCPSEEDGRNHITYSYESNHESAWTCAWSNNPQYPGYLSMGSTRKAIVVDTVSARKRKVFTNHSDVLAQVFSSTNPVLYNGTRRGEILGCDLRSLTQTRSDISLRLRQKVAVCSIKLLKDENYLVASDMSGQVRLWDLRQCLCVQEYKGHNNRHANLPICVDSTESLLYGVGQDSYTRMWSLQDGDLLRTIPCPQPSGTLNPAVIYSWEWHKGAPPGLLMGVQRSLYWYPV